MCRLELLFKLGLLDLQHVQRNGFGISEVTLYELFPLAQNVVNDLLTPGDLLLSKANQSPELLSEQRLQRGDPLAVDLDLTLVVTGDEVLDPVSRK